MTQANCPYISRGGLKLEAALAHFAIDPTGWTCADLGCSVGGFTDCLLQHGATHVYAVDTAYGDLAWTLRQDERVTVLERTNVLHFDPSTALAEFTGCDLVTLDLGWTRQAKALPAAARWLSAGGGGCILTLIKPHYEQARPAQKKASPAKRKGGKSKRAKQAGRIETMSEAEAVRIVEATLADLSERHFQTLSWCRSPITGSKGGNVEYLALLQYG
jgi:23S rRNA (cytidine1920-2'-O)/16S rRNA (cytidine1409-2'-O)-methyltransferase